VPRGEIVSERRTCENPGCTHRYHYWTDSTFKFCPYCGVKLYWCLRCQDCGNPCDDLDKTVTLQTYLLLSLPGNLQNVRFCSEKCLKTWAISKFEAII
jgi:hypothetical protein